MAITYSPKIITDSLAGCWDFGNTKSYDPRENLLTQTQNFSSWSSPGENVWTSAQTAAPDGTLTGWKGTNNSSTNNFNFFWQPVVTSVGGIYTSSVYFKNIDLPFFTAIIGINGLAYNTVWHYNTSTNELTPVFAPGNSNVTQTVTDVENGWKRITITVDVTAIASNYNVSITNVGAAWYLGKSGETSLSYNKSAFVWGVQLERNITASKYVSNTTQQYTKSTSLTDLSGYGNNLTLANGNPTWSSNNGGFLRFPTSAYFAGTGNNNLPIRNSGYTLQAWIRYPTATVNSSGGILSIGNTSAYGFYNAIRNLAAFGSFSHWWVGNNLDIATNVGGIVANQWYLLTAVYYPFSLRRLYINTTLIGSDSPTENHNVPQNPTVEIGRSDGVTFLGDIAHCAVYKTALSLDKITQNYNALKPRFNA